MDKRTLYLLIASGSLSASIAAINYYLFATVSGIFTTINMLALIIFALPVIAIKYMDYSKKKQLEEMFPVFLRDFVESMRGGMTVPNAFKNVSRNDYKALTYYIKKMTAQMDWGIPVEKVLLKFSKETKSKLIGRIVSSVIESHRFGGNLSDTFEALSNTSLEVEKLRAERRLYMNSQMMTGYIVFFVFIGVIIGLGRFLVPSLSEVGTSALGIGGGAQVSAEEYKSVFRNLILIQGFFAGLTVGKMAEGSMMAGLKHSIIMMFVGTVAYSVMA